MDTSVKKFIDDNVIGTDILLLNTLTQFNIINKKTHDNIVNLYPVNKYKNINKFFESVNSRLPKGGMFINKVEVYTNRKKRILKKFLYPINYLIYFIDVFIHRVWPKIPFINKLYFKITTSDRIMSKTETFGRLYSCGFEIINEQVIGDYTFFVAKKVKKPYYPNHPTYGPIVRLKRVGKDGRIFNVYKLRTMYPYSEYLQEYIYKKNNIDKSGKFSDDFRVTAEGKFFRRYWIDELPMLINLIKGDMKLIGVRPLSQHYFSLYTDELKKMRTEFKPGIIPPYYADLPQSFDEIMESEKKYLISYKRNPIITDIKYFFICMKNIFINKARSK